MLKLGFLNWLTWIRWTNLFSFIAPFCELLRGGVQSWIHTQLIVCWFRNLWDYVVTWLVGYVYWLYSCLKCCHFGRNRLKYGPQFIKFWSITTFSSEYTLLVQNCSFTLDSVLCDRAHSSLSRGSFIACYKEVWLWPLTEDSCLGSSNNIIR